MAGAEAKRTSLIGIRTSRSDPDEPLRSAFVHHPLWLLRFEGEEEAEYPLRWYALAVLCLALFIGQVDVTIVNIALPSIAADVDATTSDLQWVIAAYSVVLAGFVLVGGGLADRYGRKGLFMTGLALFGSASIVAVFATEAWHLIASRAVMGLGAAFFFPPALSLLAVIFQPDERGRAVSIWAATGGVATVLGPQRVEEAVQRVLAGRVSRAQGQWRHPGHTRGHDDLAPALEQ